MWDDGETVGVENSELASGSSASNVSRPLRALGDDATPTKTHPPAILDMHLETEPNGTPTHQGRQSFFSGGEEGR